MGDRGWAAHHHRRALVGFGAFGTWWGAWGALLPAIQRSADVDDGQLGAALLFVGVGALASMRATGALIDRFGVVVLPVSLALFGVAGVLPAFAEGAFPLAAALLAVGVASGGTDVAINSSSASYELSTGRPLMNLAHACFSIGVIVASAAVGLLRVAGATPKGILPGAAVALMVVAGLLHRSAVGDAAPPVPAGTGTPWQWWRPPARLAVIGALVGLAFLVENAWQSWSALHLERNLGMGPGGGATGPALFALTAAGGRLLGQRLLRHLSDRQLVSIAGMVAAAGTLLAAGAPSALLALAGIAAAGAGTSVCAPTLLGVAARGVPERQQGAAIGSVTTLAYLGFVLAPALVGFVSRLTSLRVALGAVSIAAIGVALGGRRTGGGSPARRP